MKIDKKSDVSGRAGAPESAALKSPVTWTGLLLVVIISLLFWRVFNPSYVLFSNDGPYGELSAEQVKMPSVMYAIWLNLNWLGNEGLNEPPAVSSILRTIVSPLAYAKLICPVSLFIAG